MNADIVWSVWVGAVIVTFAILEAIGLRKPGGTVGDQDGSDTPPTV